MIIRYRYRTIGGHVQVRQFVGENTGSLALAGTLQLRPEEWDRWRRWLEHADEEVALTHTHVNVRVVVVPDD